MAFLKKSRYGIKTFLSSLGVGIIGLTGLHMTQSESQHPETPSSTTAIKETPQQKKEEQEPFYTIQNGEKLRHRPVSIPHGVGENAPADRKQETEETNKKQKNALYIPSHRSREY